MKEVIINQLKNISKQHKINILYACESGSRAWGFPSKDSDYDVRFIYVRPMSWYLSIENKPDTLVFPMNDELDINGWDLKKALTLMKKYNAPLGEWLGSPTVYFKDGPYSKRLQCLSEKSFNPLSAHYHYMSQAKQFYVKKSSDDFSVKAFLYFLRSTLSVLWIEQFKTQPPLDIFELLSPLGLETSFGHSLKDLVEFKSHCLEKDTTPKQFSELMNTSYQIYNDPKRQAPNFPKKSSVDVSLYDTILLDAVLARFV